eukprot:CAMPEP_0197519534 /NCGR_PEP_ID=MMETSP1318-20131121/4802_1 /TAXON_ID=552666 /ORGANISM="Partenskyella glossopodia, Strain RCC365" /LENGTH=64 /DNA_ID=CAMNT_0043070563 /DNA_START=196 /DNA_END=390 /DNA_ORIENTATION=+
MNNVEEDSGDSPAVAKQKKQENKAGYDSIHEHFVNQDREVSRLSVELKTLAEKMRKNVQKFDQT